MSEKILVGLGNPGKKYEMTRHNMGAIALQAFAKKHGAQFKEDSKFLAKVAKVSLFDQMYHLLLPTTYMNESGQALRRYFDYYKLKIEDLLILVDDADLPFGAYRLKEKGGTGGHNGLKSIAAHLGTSAYARFRLGIGRKEGGDLADFVLDSFSKEELKMLPQLLSQYVDVLDRLCQESLEQLMNEVNVKRGIV